MIDLKQVDVSIVNLTCCQDKVKILKITYNLPIIISNQRNHKQNCRFFICETNANLK